MSYLLLSQLCEKQLIGSAFETDLFGGSVEERGSECLLLC